MSSRLSRYETLLGAVRALYDAVELFDIALAARLGVDRSGLRAVNLMEAGPISPGELGRRLHLASGSVTALLDRLEHAGHIVRHHSGTDRRRRDAELNLETRRHAGDRYEALAEALRAAFAEENDFDLARTVDALNAASNAFVTSAQAARSRD